MSVYDGRINEEMYAALIENMPYGFSYNQIVLDHNNTPADFICIHANASFLAITGLAREKITGKNFSEVSGDIPASSLQWLAEAGRVACCGGKSEFEFYSGILNKWISICVLSWEPGYFAMIFKDITESRLQYDNLRKILDFSPDLIVVTDLSGNITDCNNKVLQVFGISSRDEIIGKSALNLISPADRQKALNDMRKIFAIGSFSNIEYVFSGDGGREFPGEMSASLIRDHLNRPANVIGIAKDISERKMAEVALKASEEKLRSIFASSPDAIFISSIDGIIRDCNQEMLKLLDMEKKEELIGLCLFGFIASDEHEKLFARREMLIRQGLIKNTEYTLTTRKGRRIIAEASSSLLRNSAGEIDEVVIIAKDITERKQTEAAIKYLSYHDKLTGLYNRAFFEEKLRYLDKKRQLPISLIIGDLNGLKLTNDVFGHNEGDKLLQKLALILISCCRKEDIIARWGGDEFAIILPQTFNRDAAGICDRITLACANENMDPIQLSIALGYATKEDASQDIQQVLKEAENWMYRHKLLDNRSFRSSIISSLEKTLFERNYETEEHAQRMRQLSEKLGNVLELSSTEMDELGLLSLLHDIGKIAIPDSILTKPGKLIRDEWDVMKKHPEIGYRIAESSQELAHIADYILSHHERWDGTGYPRGLKGEEIPRLSRIIAIVDAYDVMTHSRPYKGILSHEEAIEEIKRCSGTQFDPGIADVFINIINLNI